MIELGDVTLLPGLMDMELNFLMGGAGSTHMSAVQDDPAMKLLRAIPACRKTLLAGFTTVRNLGIFVQTGGLLLDVSLMRAVDAGWFPGPRIFPSGHAITPTGGHLDPTMFAGIAPGMMPLTVEEGIANGVSEVRRAVRYQIKYGAKQIKVCASGGVMSLTGPPGAQHYSDEELWAIVDEAHRRGMRVAAHAHGDDGIRAAIEAGIDCIEHASLMSEETQALALERGTFIVPTSYLSEGMDTSKAAPEAAGQGGGGVPGREEDDLPPHRRRARRSRPAPTPPPSRTVRTGRSCGRWCSGACVRSTPSWPPRSPAPSSCSRKTRSVGSHPDTSPT